jgi:hypothetical protein
MRKRAITPLAQAEMIKSPFSYNRASTRPPPYTHMMADRVTRVVITYDNKHLFISYSIGILYYIILNVVILVNSLNVI